MEGKFFVIFRDQFGENTLGFPGGQFFDEVRGRHFKSFL
jgi:hypothetical protein